MAWEKTATNGVEVSTVAALSVGVTLRTVLANATLLPLAVIFAEEPPPPPHPAKVRKTHDAARYAGCCTFMWRFLDDNPVLIFSIIH
jgi:hypothetical protein